MSLPTITTPKYVTNLPSNGKSVEFRPLLVKDEKAIQLALSENADEIKTKFATIKNVITDCTFGKLNIEDLPFFDVEWLFIAIRNKSIKSTIDLQYTCECGKANEFIADLSKVKVDMDRIKKTTKVELDKNLGITLKYPSFSALENYSDTDHKAIKKYIRQFVENVYTEDIVTSDFTEEEFSEWLDCLTGEQFGKIQKFFINIPTIELDVSHTCECGKVRTEKLRGLQSFLA